MCAKHMSFIVFSIIVTVGVAYILGVEAAHFLNKKNRQNRSLMTKTILSNMQNLKIGDTIPDFPFENLAFEPVELSDYVSGRTVLIFMEPTCHSCLDDIDIIIRTVSDSSDFSHFVFISSGNPRQLIDLQKEYGLRMPILYDHNKAFGSLFGVWTFPFHIIINRDFVIEEIFGGILMEDDVVQILGDHSN